MSGRRGMPQPCTPRLVMPRSPRTGSRYSPSVRAMESPMIAIRGWSPGRRRGRAIGAAAVGRVDGWADGCGDADAAAPGVPAEAVLIRVGGGFGGTVAANTNPPG